MIYGSRILSKGSKGLDVEELQIRLAGFSGTVPDGDFGSGTEKQVRQFQKDFMGIDSNGISDRETFVAIDEYADNFPIDFGPLKCPCKVCGGFGQGMGGGKYRDDKPKIEAYYQYEYPGIHRMILWASRAILFYHKDLNPYYTSGYRCFIRNQQKKRKSTNHHGKAVDLDFPMKSGEDKGDDLSRCNDIRESLVNKSSAQIKWNKKNRKALEPSSIAPTWIHYDVRQYESKYLEDRFFCKDLTSLNNRVFITLEEEEKVQEKIPKLGEDTKQISTGIIPALLALFMKLFKE